MKEVSTADLGFLANSLIEFPPRFMEPVFVGTRPSSLLPRAFNGTATLLCLSGRYFAVTCFHVLEEFRRIRESVRDAVFQIGHLELDPELYLLSESSEVDLAVLEIHDHQIDEGVVVSIGEPPNKLRKSRFHEPAVWPPAAAKKEDIISFAGFPGSWRNPTGPASMDMFIFSHGATMVESAGAAHFYSRLELDKCEGVTFFDKEIDNIGGLSGGPVFAWKRDELQAQLLGIIIEYQENYDLLYIRSTRLLLENGTLLSEMEVPPP